MDAYQVHMPMCTGSLDWGTNRGSGGWSALQLLSRSLLVRPFGVMPM